jgi:hypothetical protein
MFSYPNTFLFPAAGPSIAVQSCNPSMAAPPRKCMARFLWLCEANPRELMLELQLVKFGVFGNPDLPMNNGDVELF